ncbi:hypothetical protein [Pseudomonas syringae]|uniref:hypothetical protein n=1 Tax=Pseudomonas syringae TaxID=317 RepID=UPI00070DE57D|nr:hypothetical protein [Pseudomonas syringae]KWS48653.1 hypothetical protein AL060_08590 [Pseudomonas syringae pv. rhaphiolepidis]
MFWKRDNTLKVELLTPVALSIPPAPPPSDTPEQSANKHATTNAELAFKLITYGTVASQAVLLVLGYSILVGRYEQFGIDTNELALGTPSLLLNGYVDLFSRAIDMASQSPTIGPGLLAFIFVAVAAVFVSLVTKRLTTAIIVGLSAWIGMFLFVAFFVPALGVQNGVNKGLADFNKYTHLEAPLGLDKIHTVITDKNERLTGYLILADGKSTFLLVGMKVFKLDGSSGRVIRETELSVKQPPDEPKK